MLASFPASMVKQKSTDLGIPNRFKLKSSRFSGPVAADRPSTPAPMVQPAWVELALARAPADVGAALVDGPQSTKVQHKAGLSLSRVFQI
jgi:hypothetical protein